MQIGKFSIGREEIWDIVKAWLALSFAFAILITLHEFSLIKFFYNFVVSFFTVGIGFLLHELGHKVVAQHYGHRAEFKANNFMLMMAIVTAFLGLILAAPGAVFIRGRTTIEQYGKIAFAGPFVNMALALMFLVAMKVYSTKFLWFGFTINSWLGLFNLIPFFLFDGYKILKWNKVAYGILVVVGVLFVFVVK